MWACPKAYTELTKCGWATTLHIDEHLFKIIRSESFAIHRNLLQNKIPELVKLLLLSIISLKQHLNK
jgi:hypothetical protein